MISINWIGVASASISLSLFSWSQKFVGTSSVHRMVLLLSKVAALNEAGKFTCTPEFIASPVT